MSNNITVEKPEKIDSSSDNNISKITDNFNQLYLEDNNKSLNFFREIIKEIYNIYNEERSKSKNSEQIINTLDRFFKKMKQNPNNIINHLLLNDKVDPMAQIILASCYRFGKWVGKDEHKAFIYYQRSAEMGFAEGTFCVGVCYDEGVGVERDEYKAFSYYRQSADMGHASGMFNVGCCYQDGVGISKDGHKAFMYYQKAADMGDSGGICNLGHCYQNGIGVEMDEQKAFVYYQTSADMGNVYGMYNIGYCYLNGTGVEKDEYKAFVYHQKSAEVV